MPSVTVDAGVLAVPPANASTDQIQTYVETLLDWQQLVGEEWIQIHMSERAAEALLEGDHYPMYDGLQRLLSAHRIEEYSVYDLIQIVERLLRITPSFEDRFLLEDVLSEEFKTSPELMKSIAQSLYLAEDLKRCLILSAVLANHCGESRDDHFVIVQSQNQSSQLQVSALVYELQHARSDLKPLPTPPDIFEADLSLKRSFRELICSIDEVAIWENARSDSHRVTALKIKNYKSKLDQGFDPFWKTDLNFRFNKEFSRLAREYLASRPRSAIDTVLRAMNETLTGENLQDGHELREKEGGNSPQRTRNGDKAYRRNLTKGDRLHYWKCSDGTIEFASVGSHDHFDIPN